MGRDSPGNLYSRHLSANYEYLFALAISLTQEILQIAVGAAVNDWDF
jgi:hypothetical protein